MTSDGRRVALVSGANRGIGLAIVRGLSDAGMTVVLGARDAARGEAARSQLPSSENVHACQLDVTDARSIEACIAELEREYGRLDVLVNNAGVLLDAAGRAASPDFDAVKDTLEVNVFGAWRLAARAIDLMRKSTRPRIVNLTSGMGQLSDMGGGSPGYRVSKAALNAVTRMLAAELGPAFSVNSVCPGWVKTDMGSTVAPRTVEQGADTIVWLATLPDDEAPSGCIFRDRQPIPW